MNIMTSLKKGLEKIMKMATKENIMLFLLTFIFLDVIGLIPGSVSFFEDGDEKEDVVFGVAKGSKTKDEWKDMSADDCKQIAKDSEGKYIAWGHHGEDHENEDKRNSCFMYTKIKPYKGDNDNEVSFMGCTDPTMSVLNGCKAANADGDDDSDEEKEDVAEELEELLEDL